MVMVIVNILVNTRKIQHPTSQRGNINQNLLTIIQERLGQIAQPVQTTLLHQVNIFNLQNFALATRTEVFRSFFGRIENNLLLKFPDLK